MRKNFRKILPSIISILVFSSAFIFLTSKNRESYKDNLQISPKNYLYKEKYGGTNSYSNSDISSIGFITNVRLNQFTGVSEPKIVCSPVNKNILAVSSNDFQENTGAVQVFTSEDAGINWSESEIPLSSKFENSSYSDPFMDYDTDGNLFFVSVQFDLTNNFREAIFFARSADNGKTWKSDFNFIDYNSKENIKLDRPKISVDKSAANKNLIYVTWIEKKGLVTFIMFSKSCDGGNTFSNPMPLEKNDVHYSTVNSNSTGDLFLIYLQEESKISVKRSTDGGAKWKHTAALLINPAGEKIENRYIIKHFFYKGIRINSEPSVIFSKDDDLLLTYSARGEGNDLSDVFFARMNNNTAEFTGPVRVNDDNTECDQFLPAITVDEKNNIVIMYHDSRNDADNIQTETYVSLSNDGGFKFYNEKISTQSFNAPEVSLDKYIGDYNSCVLSGGRFIGVWTDGRNNDLDIYAGTFSIEDFIENMNH